MKVLMITLNLLLASNAFALNLPFQETMKVKKVVLKNDILLKDLNSIATKFNIKK